MSLDGILAVTNGGSFIENLTKPRSMVTGIVIGAALAVSTFIKEKKKASGNDKEL